MGLRVGITVGWTVGFTVGFGCKYDIVTAPSPETVAVE